MLPSLSAYHKHSKKYSIAISELEFEYAFAETDKKRFDLLNKFSDKYLMLNELWVVAKELAKKLKRPSDALKDKALFSFCNDPRVFGNKKATKYILQQENRASSELCISFPHSRLEHDLMIIEQKAVEPFSIKQRQRNEKLKMLFWEIKSKIDNVEEWFEALAEAENDEFLKINVEHRLSFQLWDKKLWKLYIKYLEKHDSFEMLRVYSKYCRFFLDDDLMIEEYKRKLKKHAYTRVPWKNRFRNEKPIINSIYLPLYESDDGESGDDDENGEEEDDFYLEKIDMKFAYKNWSFPSPMIRYMISTTNPEILRKLHQSCKYFFTKRPKLLCYKFWCGSFSSQFLKYKKESIDCCIKLFLPFHLKNIHVTTSFVFLNSNPFLLSRVIKNVISECTAKYVELICQTLTFKEFKFLIGHGNVEYLKLVGTSIEEETAKIGEVNDMFLEDILKMVPKIKSFHNDQIFTSDDTFKILSEMHFVSKILKFYVSVILMDFEISDICDFITKNAAPFSTFTFGMDEISDEKVKETQKAVNECFGSTTVMGGKPKIIIRNYNL